MLSACYLYEGLFYSIRVLVELIMRDMFSFPTTVPYVNLVRGVLKDTTYLIGRNFVGRNFRHQTKISSLSPDEKFGPIKVKVSLSEVYVNLRGKQAI